MQFQNFAFCCKITNSHLGTSNHVALNQCETIKVIHPLKVTHFHTCDGNDKDIKTFFYKSKKNFGRLLERETF